MSENRLSNVLVTYASRSGSTAEIAEEIGNTLQQNGMSVDVLPIIEVDNILPYNAIVVGSAIRQEHWLPEAMNFMQKHRQRYGGMRSRIIRLF